MDEQWLEKYLHQIDVMSATLPDLAMTKTRVATLCMVTGLNNTADFLDGPFLEVAAKRPEVRTQMVEDLRAAAETLLERCK